MKSNLSTTSFLSLLLIVCASFNAISQTNIDRFSEGGLEIGLTQNKLEKQKSLNYREATTMVVVIDSAQEINQGFTSGTSGFRTFHFFGLQSQYLPSYFTLNVNNYGESGESIANSKFEYELNSGYNPNIHYYSDSYESYSADSHNIYGSMQLISPPSGHDDYSIHFTCQGGIAHIYLTNLN